MPPLRRLFLVLAAALVITSLLANLAFVVSTSNSRALDGVEGEMLFEAARIRQRLPLYVDPAVGAYDYGPVPSRYYVLYLPIWASIVSLIPAPAAALTARLLNSCLWFGLLIALILVAQKRLFTQAAAAAAFVAGTYTLTIFTATARPDAAGIALSGMAAARSVRMGRVDVWSGGLFALGACVKPNLIGLAVGMFAVDLWRRRWQVYPGVLGALGVLTVVLGVLQLSTHGSWLQHLLLGTAQPLNGRLWIEQVLGRGQMMGGFVLLALLAGLSMSRERSQEATMALGGLVSSLSWALLCAAKIGSASNYWIEPCVAAVLLLGRAPVALLAERWGAVGAGLVLAQALWSGVGSTRSCWEWWQRLPGQQRALQAARSGVDQSAIVLADEPGLEVMLDGRLIATPFQMTHLVRAGRYPVARWEEDVSHREIQRAVLSDDLLERPLDQVDVAHDRFPPAMRHRLRELFRLRAVEGGYYIYERRPGDRES